MLLTWIQAIFMPKVQILRKNVFLPILISYESKHDDMKVAWRSIEENAKPPDFQTIVGQQEIANAILLSPSIGVAIGLS